MQPARASPPLSRLWQGLWCMAPMAQCVLGVWLFLISFYQCQCKRFLLGVFYLHRALAL